MVSSGIDLDKIYEQCLGLTMEDVMSLKLDNKDKLEFYITVVNFVNKIKFRDVDREGV